MNPLAFSLYDAFTDTQFGGSQAAVFTDAAGLDFDQRQAIARELGMPASAFVDAFDDGWISAQFLSAVMELPMCGHGTLCLLTHMLESRRIVVETARELELRLPRGNARVSVERRGDSRYRILLDVRVPEFETAPPVIGEMKTLLGLDADALDPDLPPATARGDFVHLLLPLTGLAPMRIVKPNFSAMVDFCNRHAIDTIAVFCREVVTPGNALHLRDFCPAVGVNESAAAGTTNAAVAGYLFHQGALPGAGDAITLCAEQGLELGRPSSIQSNLLIDDGQISRLQVGGVARKVMDGHFYLQVS